MKKLWIFLIALFVFVGLSGCENNKVQNLTIEMDMDKNYDESDPFVNARLFVVKKDVDELKATISLKMDGASGTVEIKENKTGTVLWSKIWHGNMQDEINFISLMHLKNDKEYAISFTGTKIEQVQLAISFDSDSVQELEKPSE